MNELKEILLSWPVIIIACIVFWPIGCVLLYMRSLSKVGKLKSNSILLIIISIFCCLMTLAGISITLEDLNNNLGINIFVIFLFSSGAITSTVLAIKLLKKYKCYKKYVERIGARLKISVDELAQQTGDSIETTIKNISGAIQCQMIDAYINEENDIIINSQLQNNIDSWEEELERITVQCKNCGATNEYRIGEENRCEFCNSILVRQYLEQ